jgi:RpiB/LacA/LacB family sugar-phosphate isomerase
MRIFIGADHRGYLLKRELIASLPEYSWVDKGTYTQKRVDYPEFAHNVCTDLLAGEPEDRGVLICGSGIGMSIASNRFSKIYGALCWNTEVAQCAREHDGVNVLILPSNFIDTATACAVVKTFVITEFKGGIYQARLDMLDNVINK